MFNCELKQITRVKHSIPTAIKTHTHKAHELTYFVSGKGETKINGKIYRYKPGDFAFYKMGTPHDEINPVPCDVIWLHFSFFIDGVSLNEGIYSDSDGALFSALQKLRNASLEQNAYSKQQVEIFLAEAVLTAAKKQIEGQNSYARLKWKQILNYIDNNLSENIDFKTVAANYNYSYDRFRHIFTEHFGISPNSYLTAERINKAKLLLKSSDASITKIAFDCGFSTSSQFTNIFKKYVGVTPKNYRNG